MVRGLPNKLVFKNTITSLITLLFNCLRNKIVWKAKDYIYYSIDFNKAFDMVPHSIFKDVWKNSRYEVNICFAISQIYKNMIRHVCMELGNSMLGV